METSEGIVAARARHHLHEVRARLQEVGELRSALLHVELGAQRRVLRGHARRTLIGVTHLRCHATNAHDGAIGNRHAVGAQAQRLDEVGRRAQAARHNKRHANSLLLVQVATRARQRRHCRHRNVIAENQRRSSSAT